MNNTGRNRSFSAAKTMKIDAYPLCGTGDFGVQRSGKSTGEPGDGRETHISLPRSIISFNSSEDIEGERKRDPPDETAEGVPLSYSGFHFDGPLLTEYNSNLLFVLMALGSGIPA